MEDTMSIEESLRQWLAVHEHTPKTNGDLLEEVVRDLCIAASQMESEWENLSSTDLPVKWCRVVEPLTELLAEFSKHGVAVPGSEDLEIKFNELMTMIVTN